MHLLGADIDVSVFRLEYLYKGTQEPMDVLDVYARSFARAGLRFLYFKGNDSLLHYTLVDWSSGARRMVDIHNRVRSLWSKRRHPGEWLHACFQADFELEGFLGREDGRQLDDSARLEIREVALRLVYNGRAFMGRETFSLVTTCLSRGVLSGGDPTEHRSNLRLLIGSHLEAWTSSSPLFGWVGVGDRPHVEVPQMAGTAMVHRQAWFTFYTREMQVGIGASGGGDEREELLTKRLDDGSILVENRRMAPGDAGYL